MILLGSSQPPHHHRPPPGDPFHCCPSAFFQMWKRMGNRNSLNVLGNAGLFFLFFLLFLSTKCWNMGQYNMKVNTIWIYIVLTHGWKDCILYKTGQSTCCHVTHSLLGTFLFLLIKKKRGEFVGSACGGSSAFWSKSTALVAPSTERD